MLKTLPIDSQISILQHRIHILQSRGEAMNQNLIHKLERNIRKLEKQKD